MNKDKLESMIDEKGLDQALDYLANICYEKAEHVQTNWQDTHLAKSWTKAAQLLAANAFKVSKILP